MTGRYDAVIFDLEGTLVEFRYRFREARKSVIDALSKAGINLPSSLMEGATQDIFDEVEKVVESDPKVSRFDEARMMMRGILDRYEMEAFKGTKLHPDTMHVLRNLKEMRMKLALVTNDGRKATDFALKKFKLTSFFQTVVTRDDVNRFKPYPDGVMKTLASIQVEPHRALFVGDSVIDIQAGKSAGVKVVAFTGGLYDSKRLGELSPDFMIRSLTEVLQLVE